MNYWPINWNKQKQMLSGKHSKDWGLYTWLGGSNILYFIHRNYFLGFWGHATWYWTGIISWFRHQQREMEITVSTLEPSIESQFEEKLGAELQRMKQVGEYILFVNSEYWVNCQIFQPAGTSDPKSRITGIITFTNHKISLFFFPSDREGADAWTADEGGVWDCDEIDGERCSWEAGHYHISPVRHWSLLTCWYFI